MPESMFGSGLRTASGIEASGVGTASLPLKSPKRFEPCEPTYEISATVFAGSSYWKPKNHCCMNGVAIFGLIEKNVGVFGSINEFAGKPSCSELKNGIEQSTCPGV